MTFHSLSVNYVIPPFWQIIAFDELKTDYKNPIDQCASLNPLVLPEYILHILFNFLFLLSGEWFSILLNAPLIGYHIHRYTFGNWFLSVSSASFEHLLSIFWASFDHLLSIFWASSLVRYMNRPVMSGAGLYDPTSIMNADTLNKCQVPLCCLKCSANMLLYHIWSFFLNMCTLFYFLKREGWIKLAFYLLAFFYYLYGMIYSLITV